MASSVVVSVSMNTAEIFAGVPSSEEPHRPKTSRSAPSTIARPKSFNNPFVKIMWEFADKNVR